MPEGGAVVVLRDVTRIEQVERAQTEFVANVSHELRTPLTSIQGYVEMLLESEGAPLPAASEHEFLLAILKSARRMARLTDDLLALARVESGEQKLEPRAVAVEALIRETEAAVAGVVKEKGGTLEVSVTAEGDVDRRLGRGGQILSNLIENALNYGRGTNGARVQLTAERVPGYRRRFGSACGTSATASRGNTLAGCLSAFIGSTRRGRGSQAGPASGWRLRSTWWSRSGDASGWRASWGTAAVFISRCLRRSAGVSCRSQRPRPCRWLSSGRRSFVWLRFGGAIRKSYEPSVFYTPVTFHFPSVYIGLRAS